MKTYTADEYAADERLWVEYIDRDNMAPFENHSHDERVAMVKSLMEIWEKQEPTTADINEYDD